MVTGSSAPPIGNPAILVEDDPSHSQVISRYLRSRGCDVIVTRTLEQAGAAIRTLGGRPRFILADRQLPDGDPVELARRYPNVPCVLMSDNVDGERQRLAVLDGALELLAKPFDAETFDAAIRRALRTDFVESSPAAPWMPTRADEWRAVHAPGLVGVSPALIRAFAIVERVADTDVTVLITGESGTGKELIARALHSTSSRATRAFVPVNCAALPEALIESELFGHARGAFTGAVAFNEGRFRAAEGGTIFLDEVSELPFNVQAKLLRVLQEREVTGVGEGRPTKVDVRVVAATNRDLQQMVDEGTFRRDLLYRLNVIPIDLPPLRNRRQDIPALVQQFIERGNRRRGRGITGIEPDAMEMLSQYDWPGNVRQLENMIERMVVLRSEGTLTLRDLPRELRIQPPKLAASDEGHHPVLKFVLPPDGIDLKAAIEELENSLVSQALERTGGNRNRAAALLRMNRTTLVDRLKKRKPDRDD